MGQGNIIGKPNLPATTSAKGVWNLREQNTANRAASWPGYDPQWANTTLLLKTGFTDTFTDSSTNNYTVTRGGDTSQTTFTPYEPTGYWSNYFDGSGDYINCGSQTAYATGTGNFTAECWVFKGGWTGTYESIIDIRSSGNSTTGWVMGTINGSVYLYSNGFQINVANAFTLGRWNHLALVRNGSTMTIYVNGTSIGAFTTSGNYTDQNICIGTDPYNLGGEVLLGFVSNARFVKGTAVYTANFTPPTAPLTAIANTSLLTCQDNRFIDRSTNNFTLTKTGDVAVSSFGPFAWEWSAASGGGAYFDGTGDFLSAPNAAANVTNQNFTAECWQWFTTNSIGYQPIMGNTGTSDYQGWIVTTETNNLVYCYISTNGSNWTHSLGAVYQPPTNAWVHFALVRNGATVTLYANGVSIGSTNIGTAAIHSPSGAFYAGYYPYYPGGARSLTGYMANVRLVIGTAVYTANFTPPTAPLTAIANTTLLLNAANVTGSSWWDSGTGRPIRSVGTTPRSSVVPSTMSGMTSTYFDGGTSYLTTPVNPAFNFGGDFTIEGWIYPTVVTGADRCVWETRASAGDAGMVVFIDTNGKLSTYTSNAIRITSVASLTANTWQHVALVRSNGVLAFYINGAQSGTLSYATAITNPGAPRIGIRFDSAAPYTGFISNFRVLNGTAAYTAAFTPPTTPFTPTATTALILNQALSVWDATGRNALNSTATVVATPAMFTGSALSLTGSQVARAYSGTLATDFAFGTGDFTIEAWIYPTSSSGDRCIFSTRGSDATAVYFGMYTNTYSLGFVTASAWIVTSTVAAPANAWSHVACVRASGVVYLYLNGVCVGSAANTTNITDSVGTVGRSTGNNDFTFIGQMDEVRVTKAARYLGNFTPTAVPFDRDWEPPYNDTLVTSNVLQVKSIDLAGATNNVFRDDSTNNFLPVRYGDTTQGSLSPYIPTGYWSYHFDGNGDYLSRAGNGVMNFGSSNFTVEAWVNLNAMPTSDAWPTNWSSHMIVVEVGSVNAGDGNAFMVGQTKLIFHSNDTAYSSAAHTMIPGRWYHIAMSRSGNTLYFFVNGIPVGTAAFSGSVGVGNDTYVGCETSQGAWFNGHISNLRVVNGTALYTAAFTPPTQPLTAVTNTSLLTCQDNRIKDNSTNNFTLTRFGDVAVSRFDPFPLAVPVTTVATTNPGSVYFDGSGDFLSIASGTTSTLPSGNQAYTLEAWIFPTTNSGGIIGWGAYGSGGGVNAFRLVSSEAGVTNGILNYWWGSDLYSSSNCITTNRWHHVAATFDGTTRRLFVNGALVGSDTPGSRNLTTTNNLTIGTTNTSEYFTGWIANVRVLKGTAAYTAAFSPAVAPLTAITNTALLTCQNPVTITDASANNFTITRNGDARTTDLTPFTTLPKRVTYAYGGSGYFDGNGDYLTIPDNAALQMGTGNFTWEFWHFPTTFSGFYVTPIDKGYTATGGLLFQSNGADKLVIYASGTAVITSTISITPGSWHHIALVRNGTTLTLYINGVSAGAATNSTNFNSTSQMVVGANSAGAATLGQYPIYGFLANLRVVKDTAVYTSAFTPPTSPVTAISGTSLLLNFDNAGVYDGTGQRNLLTSGTAASTTTSRKYEVATQAVDGTTSSRFVPVPASPSGLAFGTGDFTVEMWIYPTTIAGATRVFYDHRTLNTQGVYPTLYLYPAGTLAYYVSSGDRITGATLATGTWYHVALSRAASQTRLFLNGVQQGATYADTNSYLDGGTGRPCIGTNGNSADGNNFAGYIEGLRISRVGRYTANFTVPSEPFPIA